MCVVDRVQEPQRSQYLSEEGLDELDGKAAVVVHFYELVQ